MPTSSAQAMQEIEDLASPVNAFLRERCVIGPGCEVEIDRLYGEWTDWCKVQGRDHPGIKPIFGRDLRAAMIGRGQPLGERQPRVTDDDGFKTRLRFYTGVGLR